MEEAIKMEQLSTLHRLENIRIFSRQSMRGIREASDHMYEAMENCLEYAFKTETSTLDELASIFGDHIEEERKIQDEVDVTNYDVIVSQKVLNFFTPPPVIARAIETKTPERFLISNLIRLWKSLESMGDLNGYIDSKDVYNLFVRLCNSEEGKQLLPWRWSELYLDNVEQFVDLMDSDSSGQIKNRKIFTFLALEASPVPTAQDIQTYSEELKLAVEGSETPNKIGIDLFVKVPAWFDSAERELRDYEKSNQFERLIQFKELLFTANKDRTGTIVIDRFVNLLSELVVQG